MQLIMIGLKAAFKRIEITLNGIKRSKSKPYQNQVRTLNSIPWASNNDKLKQKTHNSYNYKQISQSAKIIPVQVQTKMAIICHFI